MNQHEILPEPEVEENSTERIDSRESTNEAIAARQTETASSRGPGPSAIAGVAVDDAQHQLSGVTSSSVGSTTTRSVTDVDVPEIASDIDLIEKEWVQKAKAIVNATQGDPYSQNNQINKMKVDYIKKRYNKDVKLRSDN